MSDPATSGGVVCAGRLYCDLIFTDLTHMPSLGTESFAQGLTLQAGGGAFITAAYLSKLGHAASLFATLPAAPFHHVVQQQVDTFGVDTRFCANAGPNADPQITVAMAAHGDRAFLTRRVEQALPIERMSELASQHMRHLHIGELTTLLEHPELLVWARDADMSVSLDCGWDDSLKRRDLARVIGGVDIFLPSANEAQKLRDVGLAPNLAPITVVKNGAAGATLYKGADVLSQPAHPVTVVETTGAGDAFNGGFLSRWLGGASMAACLDAGIACGAVAVQGHGGVGALQHLQGQEIIAALRQETPRHSPNG